LLVDYLHDAGYRQVAVAASADSSSVWAENRGVLALADLSGYRFTTDSGRAYDVIDLSDDLRSAEFPPGALLAGSQLAAPWLDAHFRIVFAKNRTDQAEGYSLCVESLLGILPLSDKDYHYRLRCAPGEVVAELLGLVPPQFALIDALVSSHGNGGAQAPRAISTDCVIAATDAQLADYIAALKMGLDPDTSRINSTVRRRRPLPAEYSIHGDLKVYPGWRNPHPLLVESTRHRDQSVTARRLTAPWLQQADAELFPMKSAVDAKINPGVARYFGDLDHDPAAFGTLVSANYAIAASSRVVDAYRAVFDKDAMHRVEVPLGLDLDAYPAADYSAIESELAVLEPMLAGITEQAEHLQWRYVEQAVVFRYARVVPLDFERFVAKVDVSRTIQYLNDYIGGVVVPVERDAQGRPRRQAERNIYLPQPNYIALADGKPIDVSKLELVSFGESAHRMWWKTVLSENGSAIHDDGIVTFRRCAQGTHVSIVGRQLFVLPPFWQAMNLDLNPGLKDVLVTQAYKLFFDRSLANLEAVAEGRDVRVGRAWHQPAGPHDHVRPPVRAVEEGAQRVAERARGLLGKFSIGGSPHPEAPQGRVDADGFVHMKATPAQLGRGFEFRDGSVARDAAGIGQVADFLAGYAAAVQRDLAGLR
jgi:uncharacterized protein (DUF362 family)